MSNSGFIQKLVQGSVTLMLILWYTLSITGLDVHHDHEHGRTYVVACVFGSSCERIHPHSHCHDGEGEACTEDEECCSDEFHLILTQGEDAGNSTLHISTASYMDFIPSATAYTINLQKCFRHFHLPAPPPDISDILNRTCILRV